MIPVVGMKKEARMIDHASTAVVRRHLEAITKMLLGNAVMRPSLTIIAAATLEEHGCVELAMMSVKSATDVICLEFDFGSNPPKMTSITIVAPRDLGCYVYTGCRLTQRGAKTKIIPRQGGRGYFEVLPGEILHRDGSTVDLVGGGLELAQDRLRELVARGVDLHGQALIEDLVG